MAGLNAHSMLTVSTDLRVAAWKYLRIHTKSTTGTAANSLWNIQIGHGSVFAISVNNQRMGTVFTEQSRAPRQRWHSV